MKKYIISPSLGGVQFGDTLMEGYPTTRNGAMNMLRYLSGEMPDCEFEVLEVDVNAGTVVDVTFEVDSDLALVILMENEPDMPEYLGWEQV